jgi:hypothetical protein
VKDFVTSVKKLLKQAVECSRRSKCEGYRISSIGEEIVQANVIRKRVKGEGIGVRRDG